MAALAQPRRGTGQAPRSRAALSAAFRLRLHCGANGYSAPGPTASISAVFGLRFHCGMYPASDRAAGVPTLRRLRAAAPLRRRLHRPAHQQAWRCSPVRHGRAPLRHLHRELVHRVPRRFSRPSRTGSIAARPAMRCSWSSSPCSLAHHGRAPLRLDQSRQGAARNAALLRRHQAAAPLRQIGVTVEFEVAVLSAAFRLRLHCGTANGQSNLINAHDMPAAFRLRLHSGPVILSLQQGQVVFSAAFGLRLHCGAIGGFSVFGVSVSPQPSGCGSTAAGPGWPCSSCPRSSPQPFRLRLHCCSARTAGSSSHQGPGDLGHRVGSATI